MIKILELLVQKQTEEELSNQNFASKLGISRSLWELTKQEKQEIGWLISLGIVKVYPDLISELLHYMIESKPKEVAQAEVELSLKFNSEVLQAEFDRLV